MSVGESSLRKGALGRVFISYKRDTEPDESLVARVKEALTSDGHDIYVNRALRAGDEWARELEARIRASDYLIVFLTEASSRSEMVKGEIEIARGQAQKSGGLPKIVPVRVSFTGALPYPLNAYLDPIHYALWRGESDTGKLEGNPLCPNRPRRTMALKYITQRTRAGTGRRRQDVAFDERPIRQSISP